LSKGKEMPVLKLVVPTAERLVQSRLDHVTELPIEDYATLNAKTAAKAVRGLSWADVLRVRRFEEANKGRKTVLDALVREMDRLREPVAA
jgi:DnaJ-domain-containing protein 1